MSVASLRWPLDADAVREIPEQQGVFTLWAGRECVYIGYTPLNRSLRDMLLVHLALREEGRIEATHFMWETTPTPRTREGDLLQLFLQRNGRRPRYNRSGSPISAPEPCATDLRAR